MFILFLRWPPTNIAQTNTFTMFLKPWINNTSGFQNAIRFLGGNVSGGSEGGSDEGYRRPKVRLSTDMERSARDGLAQATRRHIVMKEGEVDDEGSEPMNFRMMDAGVPMPRFPFGRAATSSDSD